MLGELTERMALWASRRRRILFALTLVLLAAGALAFVRLPRPRDFAADLPGGHPVEAARRAQRAFPLILLRVEPVDAAAAPAVAEVVASALARDPIWLGQSARAGAVDGSARALLNARGVAEQLPPLATLLSLRRDATLAQGLETLAALPDPVAAARVVDAVTEVVERGKAAAAKALPDAAHGLVRWPMGAASASDTWRIRDGGLDVWLRAQPGTAPEALSAAVAAVTVAARAGGLRVQAGGYPLELRSDAAPRWHGMLAAIPLAVAAGLAWALGASPAAAAASAVAGGALLAVPLMLLLLFGAGLDPAATWAFCAAGGLFGGVLVLYQGLRVGGRSTPDPLLRQVRRALRDSVLAVGLVSVLCLLAAGGVRWAAPAAAISLAGTALALPVYWGLFLPAIDLSNLGRATDVPVMLQHASWGRDARFFTGIALLLALMAGAATIERAPVEAPPPALTAGLPLALPVRTEDAQTLMVRLRTLPQVQAAEGPAPPPDESERLALALDAQATLAVFPAPSDDAAAPAESIEALRVATDRLAEVPALAPAAGRLRGALTLGAEPGGEMRIYLAARSFGHALDALRSDVRALIERGTTVEPPSPFHVADEGRVLVVVSPARDAVLSGVANPLDTFATVRQSPLTGGMTWATASLGVLLLAFAGIVAVGGRAYLLVVPPIAAGLPVLRAHALLGTPVSTLGTSAAWTAAIGATLFCATVLRIRTGALAPRGLRVAVGACVVIGMLAGSVIAADTPFGPASGVALAMAAAVMALTYLTA
jgi:hypothetical protein